MYYSGVNLAALAKDDVDIQCAINALWQAMQMGRAPAEATAAGNQNIVSSGKQISPLDSRY
jgi:hypothetical protein